MEGFKEDGSIKIPIRPHRGGLFDPMVEVEEIPKTLEAIVEVINRRLVGTGVVVTKDRVGLSKLCYDHKANCYYRWVIVEGCGLWGLVGDRPTKGVEND